MNHPDTIQAALDAWRAESNADKATIAEQAQKLVAKQNELMDEQERNNALNATIADLRKQLDAAKPVEPKPPTDGGKPPTGRRKIVLTAPWDSKDIQEDNVEIDCNGLDLIAEKIQGQKIRLSNAILYNAQSIYCSANLDCDITFDNVIVADLLKDPKGNTVRGVMTPDMRAAGWSLVTPAIVGYVAYLEAKANLWTPGATSWPIVWDRPYGSIVARNSNFGSSRLQHQFRTYGGIDVLIDGCELWNWANLDKGDQRNGGSSLRIHGTSATIRNSRIGWYAKIGSEIHPYSTDVNIADDVQFFGGVQWPGNKNYIRLAGTLNGKRVR
jgi:hypothetical protein